MVAILVRAMLDRLPDAAQFLLVEDAAAFVRPSTLIGLLASAGVAEEGLLLRAFAVTEVENTATAVGLANHAR